jgi:hypothetical protein
MGPVACDDAIRNGCFRERPMTGMGRIGRLEQWSLTGQFRTTGSGV